MIRRLRRAELGVRGMEEDLVPVLKEATDSKGGARTERELFAP